MHKDNSSQSQPVAPPPAQKPRKKSAATRPRGRMLYLALVFVVALLGGSIGAYAVVNLGSTKPLSVLDSTQEDGNTLRSETEQGISEVASRVAPSVVSIAAGVESAQGRLLGQGAGTGVIVSKNGYIMTNNHVVQGASTVSVTTSGGDIYNNVQVVGNDPLNDIAFLKIKDVDGLQAAELGDSSTLSIGQNVFAIGNSLGEYRNTVTSGIVSGLNRPVVASSQDGSSTDSLSDLIQTDAAINPGNSGGPLVNSAGQVIGINTAVASDAQGIGFAIPINATKGVLASVIDGGKVKRAYIGVRYLEVTPAIAHEQKLSVKEGALIQEGRDASAVVEGGPADKAGLKSGDIVTAINDMKVGAQGGMMSIIGMYKPGDTVEVTYLREGKERTTKLTLAEYEEPAASTQAQERSSSESRQPLFDPRSLFGF